MHPNTHNRSSRIEDLLLDEVNSPLYLGFFSALTIAYLGGWGSVLLQVIALA